jgi:hypothetical protein
MNISKINIAKVTLFAAVFAVIIMACKKEKVAAIYMPPSGSFALLYNQVLVPSCALSGCHLHSEKIDGGHLHGIGLSGDSTYLGLINTTPKNYDAQNRGFKIIVPGDTAKSFFYHKINYTNSIHKYGAPMPGGGLTLSPKQIQFIQQWILAGAPLAGHVADSTLLN